MLAVITSFFGVAFSIFIFWLAINEQDKILGGFEFLFGLVVIIASLIILATYPYKTEIITPKNLLVFKGNKYIYLESSELNTTSENYRFLEFPKEKIKIRQEYGLFSNKLNEKFIIDGE